jgi:hypothetical protein
METRAHCCHGRKITVVAEKSPSRRLSSSVVRVMVAALDFCHGAKHAVSNADCIVKWEWRDAECVRVRATDISGSQKIPESGPGPRRAASSGTEDAGLHWAAGPGPDSSRPGAVQCTTRYYNTRYKDSLDITTIFPVIFLICSVRVVVSSKFTALDIRNTAWAEKLPSAAVGRPQKFGQPKKNTNRMSEQAPVQLSQMTNQVKMMKTCMLKSNPRRKEKSLVKLLTSV